MVTRCVVVTSLSSARSAGLSLPGFVSPFFASGRAVAAVRARVSRTNGRRRFMGGIPLPLKGEVSRRFTEAWRRTLLRSVANRSAFLARLVAFGHLPGDPLAQGRRDDRAVVL